MEMNEAMSTIQMQKSYMSTLDRQINLLESALRENALAKTTLEGLKGKKEGSDVLMPLGGQTKVFVKIQTIEKVLVNIGSEVEAEMTIPKAIQHHEKQISDISEEKKKLQEKYKELEKNTAALSNAVEQAYMQQMQQQSNPQGMGQQQNVMS